MGITGTVEPTKAGVAVVDVLTGLHAAVSILAAVHHRDRTGEGQRIDMALPDVQGACLANQAMNYLVSGKAPRRMGKAPPNIVPSQDFPPADGDMILAIGNDGQFARFCDIAGHGPLSKARDAASTARFTSSGPHSGMSAQGSTV